MLASWKAPPQWTSLYLPLNTSIVPAWKLAAYRKSPLGSVVIARPLYTAFGTVTPTCAQTEGAGAGTPGFQPVIEPFSVAKMNSGGPWNLPDEMSKFLASLKTWPVGAPVGMPTTRGTGRRAVPSIAPRYSVVTSLPLSETQIGVAGPAAMPHGLTRLGSVLQATPGMSDSRFVWRYSFSAAPLGMVAVLALAGFSGADAAALAGSAMANSSAPTVATAPMARRFRGRRCGASAAVPPLRSSGCSAMNTSSSSPRRTT